MGFRTRQSYHETEEAFKAVFDDTFGLLGLSSGNGRTNTEVDENARVQVYDHAGVLDDS